MVIEQGGPGRFGDRKVFVSALWRRVGRTLGMSLDEFKQWLLAQQRTSALQLARADRYRKVRTR
jgi:hypothetical protein